jgi:hypothetical protein
VPLHFPVYSERSASKVSLDTPNSYRGVIALFCLSQEGGSVVAAAIRVYEDKGRL